MWLLDFDCCREMSMNEKGIDHDVAAFLGMLRTTLILASICKRLYEIDTGST